MEECNLELFPGKDFCNVHSVNQMDSLKAALFSCFDIGVEIIDEYGFSRIQPAVFYDKFKNSRIGFIKVGWRARIGSPIRAAPSRLIPLSCRRRM